MELYYQRLGTRSYFVPGHDHSIESVVVVAVVAINPNNQTYSTVEQRGILSSVRGVAHDAQSQICKCSRVVSHTMCWAVDSPNDCEGE